MPYPSLAPWDKVDEKAGVYVKTLTECPRNGSFRRLVRFRPGAARPSFDGSGGVSELWIVSGGLCTVTGETVHPWGTYGNLEVNLLDGSWTSPVGCTAFEVRNRI